MVAYPNAAGTYLYTCKTSAGAPVACDPNMGPASTTGGKGGGSTSPGKAKLLWWGTLGKFKIWSWGLTGSMPTFQHTDSPVLSWAAVHAVDGAAAQEVGGSVVRPFDVAQEQVSCNANVTQVSDNPIHVSAGGKIIWGDSAGPSGFTLNVPTTVCSTITPGKVCPKVTGTSGQSYTYTAQENGCGANDNLQIQVN